jgi:hypothetical protein
MEAQAAGRIHPLKVCVTAAAVVNPGCALTDFNAKEAAGSPLSDAGQANLLTPFAAFPPAAAKLAQISNCQPKPGRNLHHFQTSVGALGVAFLCPYRKSYFLVVGGNERP